MIAAFPRPLPDELLYSVLGRYQSRLGISSTLALSRDVWGTVNATPVVDLPGRLSLLVSRLPQPCALSQEDLLLGHTTFPYYACFVPEARREAARRSLVDENGHRAHAHLGARRSVPYPSGLVFCSTCYEADRSTFGTAYWHRVHQLPGVYVCPRHGVPLRGVEVGSRRLSAYRRLDDKARSCGRPLSAPRAPQAVLLSLARQADGLLQHAPAGQASEDLHGRYRDLARWRGWVTPQHRIAIEDLEIAAVERFGASLLEALGCVLPTIGNSWLKVLLNVPRQPTHPLRHLLLLDLLDVDAAGAIEPGQDTEPPDGPRARERPVRTGPCRAPLCEQFEDTASHLSSHPYPFRFVYVRCPACGLSYWYRAADPQQWGVLDTGPRWEAAIRDYTPGTGRSMKELARDLGLTRNMLEYRRQLWGLTQPRRPREGAYGYGTGATPRHRQKIEARRIRYRAWLEETRAEHPEWTRTQLRVAHRTAYTWLYHKDPEWMEERLPPRRPLQGPARRDWAALDRELTVRVPEAVARALAAQERPHQLTFAAVSRELGQRFDWYQAERLPSARAAILRAMEEENGDRLLARRLGWAEDDFVRRGVVPSPSELCHAVGFMTIEEGRRRFDVDAVIRRIARRIADHRTGGGGQDER